MSSIVLPIFVKYFTSFELCAYTFGFFTHLIKEKLLHSMYKGQTTRWPPKCDCTLHTAISA